VEDDRVRLISARKATGTERKDLKKTLARKKGPPKQEELRSEYRFDYGKSKPNRFASKMPEDAIAVVLEPDIAAIFKSSKTVNALLRSIASAMRQSSRKKRNQRRA